MKFWWHASNDSKDSKRHWFAGRFWLHRRTEAKRARLTCFSAELTVPCSHCGWSIGFGGGDSGRNVGFTFAVPLLFTLYLTIENAFKSEPFDMYDFDRGHDRNIGCCFHSGGFWWQVWRGNFASWSRAVPRWRQGHIDFADVLLGKWKHTHEVLKADIPVVVPMLEGPHYAVASFERRTWKRPRWFTKVRLYTEVKVPKGIPFAGKGENSWDCGDDGLFGYAIEGHDIPKAIALGVESVLRSRERYGMPSNRAIQESLGVDQ